MVYAFHPCWEGGEQGESNGGKKKKKKKKTKATETRSVGKQARGRVLKSRLIKTREIITNQVKTPQGQEISSAKLDPFYYLVSGPMCLPYPGSGHRLIPGGLPGMGRDLGRNKLKTKASADSASKKINYLALSLKECLIIHKYRRLQENYLLTYFHAKQLSAGVLLAHSLLFLHFPLSIARNLFLS